MPELAVYPLHGGQLHKCILNAQRMFSVYGRGTPGVDKGIATAFASPEVQKNPGSYLTAVSLYGDTKLSEEA